MTKTYNTGETEQELREKYNPEGSDLRKAQLRMLDMLKYIDKVCTEQGIEYQLNSGTLLGAVRHGGFIPWDDDTDIMVPRKDYDRLCKYLKEHPHPQFVLQDHTTDPQYFNFWSVLRDLKSEYVQEGNVHNARKYRGVQVDIFPYDQGVITRLKKVAHFLNYNYVYRPVRRSQWSKARRNFWLLNTLVFPSFRMISKVFGDKKVCGDAYGQAWFEVYPTDTFFPSKQIEFEGEVFNCPNNPEGYFNIVYKDVPYRDLPPEDKRDIHKTHCIVWE